MPVKLAKPNAPAKRNSAPGDPATLLLAWYARHARRLPWRVGPWERSRGVRPDPYRVWLSEIMLQQTTVKAVAPYFKRFVERWPDVVALAAADEKEVMSAWAGLGYYSRARNLVACSRAVARRPGARFPESVEELAAMPGIGAYTSAAIAAIAFGQRAAVIDGNVERVVARLFAIEVPFPAAKSVVREKLEPLVPAAHPGEFAEALMDLGATICTPRRPACGLCPWREVCLARSEGRETALPVKAPRRARPVRHGTAFIARRSDGAILLRRRPPSGMLGGMCEVPGTDWRETRQNVSTPPFAAAWQASSPVEHVFTHFTLKLSIERAELKEDAAPPAGHWWAPAGTLSEEALPSVMKKAIEAAYPGATKPLKRLP